MLRKCIKVTAGLLAGVLTALTVLELLLRTLPVFKGEYGAEPDASWPAQHLIPNSTYTFSAGWDFENVHRGHINNMGYVAPFDYHFGTEGLFVVGDSFVVNMMNSYSDGFQDSLQAMLSTKTPVLGFGTVGGNLAQDLGVAALIGEHFRPSWAVVLVTRGNFVNGFGHTPGYFRWVSVPRPDVQLNAPRRHGVLARFVRDLALVQYVRSNLRADVGRLLADRGSEITGGCGPPESLSVTDKALVHFMVEQLPVRFKLSPSRVILVFDPDREAIYNPEFALCSTRDSLVRRLLEQEAATYGIKVINLEGVFRTHYLETGERFDYLPIDGHWNGVAHRLAAEEVARYINARNGASPH